LSARWNAQAPLSARILLALAAGVLSLTLAEVGIRLVVPPSTPAFEKNERDQGFDWRAPAPYVAFHATPDADVRIDHGAWVTLQSPEDGSAHVVTDAYGFRYAGDVDAPKAPGELRIFLLGGSVTVLGLSNESTLCAAIEEAVAERLARRGPVRCVSAGILSGVSDQELARLVHHVSRLAPDVVISYSGFNDAIARQEFDPRLGYPLNWFVYENAYVAGRAAARRTREAVDALPAWQLILSRSRLATTLWPGLAMHELVALADIRAEATDHPRPAPEDVAGHFMENWDLMRRISRATGARFVGILQPFRPEERDAGRFADFYGVVNERIEAGS